MVGESGRVLCRQWSDCSQTYRKISKVRRYSGGRSKSFATSKSKTQTAKPMEAPGKVSAPCRTLVQTKWNSNLRSGLYCTGNGLRCRDAKSGSRWGSVQL